MSLQAQIDAMEREYSAQLTLLSGRAVHLAAQNAKLMADNEELLKRIAELEKPKDSDELRERPLGD